MKIDITRLGHMGTKMLRIMKLIIILLTAAALQVSAKGHSQGITLSLQNVPLKTAFVQIRKAAPSFDFFYDESWLKDAKNVSIEVRNASLNEVLEQCFKDQPFTFTIAGSIITVHPKNTSSITADKNIPPNIRINGVVKNDANEPVEGATIKVINTDKATTTNERGEFFLDDVSEDAILEISHISYESQKIGVKNKSTLHISLKSKVSRLSDVTINTGYQTFKINEVTGSVVTLRQEQLDQRVSSDILSKLEGMTNGLVFNKRVDGANSLRIRGESTIFANPNPLIVIDNFPYDGDINSINPNDVENITVLKDAAAASIWGVQAGNGVIVITTKKGKLNQPLKIELSTNFTTSAKPDLYHYPRISSSDYIDFEKSLFADGYFDGSLFDPNLPAVSPVVELLDAERNGLISNADATTEIEKLRNLDLRKDLSKYFYRNPSHQQHLISLSGGTSNYSYYFSTGFDKDISPIIGNAFNRITLNSQNTFKPVSRLEINVGLSYIQTASRNNGGSNIPNVLPYSKLYDENGRELSIAQHRQVFEDTIGAHNFVDWKYYPVSERESRDNRQNNYETRLTAKLKFDILKGLDVVATYQYLRNINKTKDLTLGSSYYLRNSLNSFAILDNDANYTGSNFPAGGILDFSLADQYGQYGRLALDYNRRFGNQTISVLTGYEVREIKTEGNSSRMYGYNSNTGSFIVPDLFMPYQIYPSFDFGYLGGSPGTGSGLSSTGTTSRFRSYFGNISYNLLNKYIVSGSARLDGTNYFGVKSNKRIVPLWSTGIKWMLSNEDFYHSAWMPKLALRATYGYNGNLASNLAAIATLKYPDYNSAYLGLPFATINNIPNPRLRWEKTALINFGIDFGSKNDRFTGSIEYFQKKGVDLIGDAKMDPTTGVSLIRGNFSGLKSKGIDIQVLAKLIDAKFRWTTSLNFNYAAEKVTKYDIPASPLSNLYAFSDIYPQINRPLYSLYSFRWGGLDPATGDPRVYLSDTVTKNYNAQAAFKLSDLIYSGRYNPPITGSVYNSVSWNGFSLGFNLTFKLKYYFRRSTINYSTFPNGFLALHKDFSKRWRNPGDESLTDVPSLQYPFDSRRDQFYSNSTALVEKGDHIRLQWVNLTYDFKKGLVDKIGIDAIRLFVYANNLGIIWRSNDKKIDPDYPYTDFPAPRTFSAGAKISF